MKDFFRDMVETFKDGDTSLAEDGLGAAEFTGYIDTGSYSLNAALSGSIFGGVPNNKIGAFAGETTTGKTFFVLGIVKSFLDSNPEAGVIYYDTEAAVTRDMMKSRGIDTKRVIIAEPETIQKFREHGLKFLEAYGKTDEADRPPMMMVLDSLGMLSTSKELADSLEGNDTRDMTKAQVIKATFRVLTLKCARYGVPMLITNHVYELVGSYVPTKEMSGGSGLKFAASYIAFLTKRKEKVDNQVVGNIIKVTMRKSRLSKENAQVECLLTYDKGLDRYYGLLDLAEKYGIFKKVSTRYELPDGSKVFGKNILENPKKYYTDEVLQAIDEAAKKEFSYGTSESEESLEVESGEE